MSITIIIEDGSNKQNANSYIDIAGARQFAMNRGVTLSSDDDTVAAMIIKGTDYLESYAGKYKGCQTYDDQSLQWPRTGAFLVCGDCGKEIPSDAIPQQLKDAQCQLVMAVNAGTDLMPITTFSDYVTQEVVGPISTTYADPTQINGGDASPVLPMVDALLAGLLKNCGGAGFRTVRV